MTRALRSLLERERTFVGYEVEVATDPAAVAERSCAECADCGGAS